MTKNGTRIKVIVSWEKKSGGKYELGGEKKRKSALFCSIEKKKREREKRNKSCLCECMTENLKYIESQGFA